jgi:hypothetical protein
VKWPPETVEECSAYYESAYRAGRKHALIKMIGACAISGWIIPKWAGDIIEGADGYAASGELSSWDEVFGKPNTRKKARKWASVDRVYFDILGEHLRGVPIDDLLFERIGKKLKIGGKTKVKELYRLGRNRWKPNAGK